MEKSFELVTKDQVRLQDEVDKLREQVATLTNKVDDMSEQIASLTKTIEDIQKGKNAEVSPSSKAEIIAIRDIMTQDQSHISDSSRNSQHSPEHMMSCQDLDHLSSGNTTKGCIDTVKPPYCDHSTEDSSDRFADLVTTWGKEEQGSQKDRISEGSTGSAIQEKISNAGKKRGSEAQMVDIKRNKPHDYNIYNPRHNNQSQGLRSNCVQTPRPPKLQPMVAMQSQPPPHPSMPQSSPSQIPSQHPQPYSQFTQNQPTNPAFRQSQAHHLRPRGTQNNPKGANKESLPHLPLPLSYIYRQLLEARQIAPAPLSPLKPPYPRWYDANARCEYHAGAVGHSTDDCSSLRYKIHNLIKHGWIKFEEAENQPSANMNPFLNRGAGGSDSKG